MDTTTVQELRRSPGITTTLVPSIESQEAVVLRRVDLSLAFPWTVDWLDAELEAIGRARLPHVVPARIVDRIDLIRPYMAGLDIRGQAALDQRACWSAVAAVFGD